MKPFFSSDAMAPDEYLTISTSATASIREKASRFIAWAFPVENEDQIRSQLEDFRKRFHDATHICYAWRLGRAPYRYRANDDGEPSGTAGLPILGQIQSRQLTQVLVMVIRYYGGTKLGASGLIQAYREAASLCLDACPTKLDTFNQDFLFHFQYPNMNSVMRIIKENGIQMLSQDFGNDCILNLRIRDEHFRKVTEALAALGQINPPLAQASQPRIAPLENKT